MTARRTVHRILLAAAVVTVAGCFLITSLLNFLGADNSALPITRATVTANTGGVIIATAAPFAPSCPGFQFTCSELTCDQAYACLNAGASDLDRDHDGIPCEAICGATD